MPAQAFWSYLRFLQRERPAALRFRPESWGENLPIVLQIGTCLREDGAGLALVRCWDLAEVAEIRELVELYLTPGQKSRIRYSWMEEAHAPGETGAGRRPDPQDACPLGARAL